MPKVSAAHHDARRQQIIDAATECFLREGFHRTSMLDIQREAGLSAGAIYTYFAGKDDIIEAVADERHRRESEHLRAAFAGTAEANVAFHRAVHNLFESLAEPDEQRRRRLGIQMWAEALRSPRILEVVRRGLEQRSVVVESLRSEQREGRIRADLDPDAMSRAGLALLQGFMLQQAWEPDVDLDAYVQVVDALVDALAV